MNMRLALTWLIVTTGALPVAAAAPDKSGVKPSAISLPSGAGSIEGLGESFEPQLNTGSSTYGIALALPPGRAGLTPKLHLAYNSGLGNSIVGLGWSLDLPVIKRQTDKGFPVYGTSDVFLFNGEELVPLSNPSRDWRCENESQFQRLRQVDTDNDFEPDAWEVTDRDGTVHRFGQHRGAGDRWSVVAHPDFVGLRNAFDATYCWALDTTVDLHGNRIEYEYLPPDGNPDSTGVLYPSRIRYSFLDGNYHEVRFRYEGRTDVFEDCRPTFPIRIGKRLAGVDVSSHYGGVSHPVRSYDLEYQHREEDRFESVPGALDLGVSTLKRFVQRDRSGKASNFLPPLLFAYSPLVPGPMAVRSVDALPAIELGTADGSVQITDVDGDGLPDLLQTTPFEQRFCLNLGEVRTDSGPSIQFSGVTSPPSPPALQLSLPESTLTDWDNDGLVDYVQLSSDGLGEKTFTVYRNAARLDRATVAPPGMADAPVVLTGGPAGVSFQDPRVRQMDLNFDKVTDFVILEPGPFCRFTYFFRGSQGTWEPPIGPVDGPADMPGSLSFERDGTSNPAVHLADLNGDRLQDLVLLETSGGGVGSTLRVQYWPYRGLARWSEGRFLEPAPGDAIEVEGVDLRDVLVQDLTGDGLADLAILRSGGGDSSEMELRINIAGRWWSPPMIVAGLPRHLPRDPVNPTTFRQADLNGNGSADLIWRNRTAGEDSLRWLDLLPDGKPNLLVLIDNSLGKRTEITYGSSTEDLVRARTRGHPWTTVCPFPNQVVRRIRTTCGFDLDGVPDGAATTTDHYVAEFHYRDAYYDAFEREFRGFAFAERIDYGDDFLLDTNLLAMVRAPGWQPSRTPTGQVSGPTLVTRYRYLTGAPDGVDNDEYPATWGGSMLADEVSAPGGREEEILKGRQVWLEKVDPWVLHDPAEEADFDRGAWLAVLSTNASERLRLTPDAFVYQRTRQEWTVRRLYRPEDPALAPSGRFAAARPSIGVREGEGGSGRSVSFAFVSAVTNEILEANGLLEGHLGYPRRAPVRTAQISDVDDYGNPILDRNEGVIGNPDYDDERVVATDYALEGEALERWVLGKPSRIRVSDETGAFVSETRHYYDGDAFQGLPLHQLGGRALLHRTEQVVTGPRSLPALGEPSERVGDPRLPAGTAVQQSRTAYDAYGNAVLLVDPLGSTSAPEAGHARRIDFDPDFRTYPSRETIYVAAPEPPLEVIVSYDPGFGVITQSTDFNGNRTTYVYDSFARLRAIVKPGDSSEFPTAFFDYQPADPHRGRVYAYHASGDLTVRAVGTVRPSSRVVSRLRERAGEPGTVVGISYTDGCGRKLAEAKEGDTPGHWIVPSAQSYNRRLAASATWLPFDLTSGSDDQAPPHFNDLWPASRPLLVDRTGGPVVKADVRFDPLGREIMTINPPETHAAVGDEAHRTRTRAVLLPLEKRIFDENDNQAGGPNADTPMVHFSDGLDRLIAVQEVVRLHDDGTPGTDLKAWTTRYRYDLSDNLTHITDSQGNEKWFRYDGLKRKLFMNDADRGTMTYVYDAGSNLRETLDAKAQRIQYTYDGVNRLQTEDYLDARGLTPDVTYHYDRPQPDLAQGDGTTATANNARGMLAWVEDLSGEEHTSYDARGRVEWVVKRIPDPEFLSHPIQADGSPSDGPRILVSYRTGFSYDSLDRVTTLTYPDNDQIGYRYSPRNLLHQIVGGIPGELTPDGLILTNIAYRASDQLARIDYGNGVRTTYDYDPRQRMNRLHTVSARGGEGGTSLEMIHFVYDFDGVSNIRSITDARPLSVVPAGDPRRNTQVFEYDDLYRLTRASYNPEDLGKRPLTNSIAYRYDRIGNMLSQTSDIVHDERGLPVANLGDMDSGGTRGRWNRRGRGPEEDPGPHALTAIRRTATPTRLYPYDANGNMTVIDGITNTWDFKDRLVRAESTEMRAEYSYDYTDRRITKRVFGRSRLSASRGFELVEQRRSRLIRSDGALEAQQAGAGESLVWGKAQFVLYPDKNFEVREHDAPTKYIWSGNTRVARLTGSLTTNPRVQRFRLWPGWNLISLAVTVENLVGQLRASASRSATGKDNQSEAVLRAAYFWNSLTNNWQPAIGYSSLPDGTVLWIQAATNVTSQVIGAYINPVKRVVGVGASFQPGTGFDNWDIQSEIISKKTLTAWLFDSSTQSWKVGYSPILSSESDQSSGVSVGDGFMARASAATTLEVPDSALRIHYYHQDHLQSSCVLSDAHGNPTKENAYYAFGMLRPKSHAFGELECYAFCQKERDAESGLDYFESRFLAADVARFCRTDPMRAFDSEDARTLPQRLNVYAYCINQPISLCDPMGLSETPVVDIVGKLKLSVDIVAGGSKKGFATLEGYLGASLEAEMNAARNISLTFCANTGASIELPFTKIVPSFDRSWCTDPMQAGSSGSLSRDRGINQHASQSKSFAFDESGGGFSNERRSPAKTVENALRKHFGLPMLGKAQAAKSRSWGGGFETNEKGDIVVKVNGSSGLTIGFPIAGSVPPVSIRITLQGSAVGKLNVSESLRLMFPTPPIGKK